MAKAKYYAVFFFTNVKSLLNLAAVFCIQGSRSWQSLHLELSSSQQQLNSLLRPIYLHVFGVYCFLPNLCLGFDQSSYQIPGTQYNTIIKLSDPAHWFYPKGITRTQQMRTDPQLHHSPQMWQWKTVTLVTANSLSPRGTSKHSDEVISTWSCLRYHASHEYSL